jgi:hypothetical protein
LLSGAKASGLFSLGFPAAGPHGSFDRAAGCFEFAMRPRLTLDLPCLELRAGDSRHSGVGRLSGPNQIRLSLRRDGDPEQVSGRLFPLRVELGGESGTTVE